MVDINATLIAQIINFLILVAVLAKFAYKPLLNMLEERQRKIQESLDTAEQEKLAAEKLRQEYIAKLNEARIQAQAIVDNAAKAAEQTKDEIIKEAREESARLLKAAQEEISREKDKALNELRGEVVTLSVAFASKIISKNIDDATNAQLVDEFINNLGNLDNIDKKIGGLPC